MRLFRLKYMVTFYTNIQKKKSKVGYSLGEYVFFIVEFYAESEFESRFKKSLKWLSYGHFKVDIYSFLINFIPINSKKQKSA